MRWFQSVRYDRYCSRSAIWAGVAPVTAAKLAASVTSIWSGSVAADMGQQGGERAGSDAFDARGLAQSERPDGDQLVADLV